MRDHDVPDRGQPAGRTLVAGALAALALGGWWWVSYPPPPPHADAPPARVIIPDPATRSVAPAPHPVADAWSDGSWPDGSRMDGSRMMAERRATRLPDEEISALLPVIEGMVLRVGVRLAPGARYIHDGPAASGGDHLLEVACLGDGELTATVTLPDYGFTRLHLRCDARVAELPFAYRPGYTAIELASEGRAPLDAGFQISRR
jgi:hypothetical protein